MRISLAEEIREISQVAPKDFDPEELHFEKEDTAKSQTAATEHYLLELGYVCINFTRIFGFFIYRPPRDR